MVFFEAICLLVTLMLMPFFTHGEPLQVKLFYVGICGILTPFIGIPVYRPLMK